MTPPNPALARKPVKILQTAAGGQGIPASLQATPAAPDPEKALRSVLDIVNRLTDLLERERELIVNRKVAEHAELLKVKQRLTLDYHASLQMFATYPGLLKQVPESLRNEARVAGERLAATVQRNARGLRAAIIAIQKLTQTIVALVKKEKLPEAGYGKIRSGKSTIGQYSPSCPPVVVSRNA